MLMRCTTSRSEVVASLLALLASWAQLFGQSAASTPVSVQETLLYLQSSWSILDGRGGWAPADRVLGWQPGSDPCLDLWHGVQCVCVNDADAGCQAHDVVAISLSAELVGQQLHGLVPDVFDRLPRLQYLDLGNNYLQGEMPSTIFRHPALQTVTLRNNFFAGPIHGTLSEPNNLHSLDIRFNMLTGAVAPTFCNVPDLLVSGNSLLCGSSPGCAWANKLTAASGTGLTGGGGMPRPCSMPVAGCVAPPGLQAAAAASIPSDIEPLFCKAAINREVLGRVPVTISFSIMSDVDILMIEFTDSGLHAHRTWFWAQDYMLRALLDPKVQLVVGSKLSKPHSISRPGELPTRSTPPNALTLNIGDLPGDLLQASQLAVTVTAARVLPDNTDGSIRLGPHEVSLLQMMTPYISVHRTPPEILYTSLDESYENGYEMRVTWEVQHSYAVRDTRLLLLYAEQVSWNEVIQSIANESTQHVLAVSPALNGSASTYTFSWRVLIEASRSQERESDVIDSSSGFSTSQATLSGFTLGNVEWWHVQGSRPTEDGGTLVSSSMLLGHGMDDTFPTGMYIISVQVVDEHGVPGSSLIGPLFLEDAVERHGTVLLAAYVFASGIIVSACVYWCVQRCLYGYAGKILRHDSMLLPLREVEDYFEELTQAVKPESVPTVDLAKDSEMCLVVSDMENSTLLSVENPTAFAASQDIHDAIMMELIQQCYGLELLREGDSFRVAFKCSEQAIAFCLKVQFRLLETAWTSDILSMKDCEEIRDDDHRLLFAGVRVRLGMYWADQGTVVALRNKGTSTYNIRGPGMDTAVAISDSVHGGQSVFTAEVWDKISNKLPLAGFPVVEHLGRFSYPDDRYSGDLYQLCGRAYKPLPRSFPPLRGITMENDPSNGLSTFASSFTTSLTADGNMISTQDPAAQATTLVCCSVTPLTSRRGSDMNADHFHNLTEVREQLDKKMMDYAKQWGGTVVKFTGNNVEEQPLAPWMWILAFDMLASALRYVFSMQYGMLSHPWKHSCMRWFPPPEKGFNRQVVFQGPRITMVVHTINTLSESLIPAAHKNNPVPSEASSSYMSCDTRGVRDLSSPSSPSSASKEESDQQPQRSHVLNMSCQPELTRPVIAEGSPQLGQVESAGKFCFQTGPQMCTNDQDGRAAEQEYPDNPGYVWRTHLPPNAKPTGPLGPSDSDYYAGQKHVAELEGPNHCSAVQRSTKPCTGNALQSHRRVFKNQDQSISLSPSPKLQEEDPNSISEQSPLENACHGDTLMFRITSDAAAGVSVHGKEVDFLVTLAACGLLNPGQIVLTDCAFTHYQELHVSVSEVYDHGVFRFDALDIQSGLKELLPARLFGRQFMPLCDAVSGVTKMRKGYNDAPSIDDSMCICFCKLTMPEAVRNAERMLLKLWTGQKRLEDQCCLDMERMQSGATVAGNSITNTSYHLGALLLDQILQPCDAGTKNAGSVANNSPGHETPDMTNQWVANRSIDGAQRCGNLPAGATRVDTSVAGHQVGHAEASRERLMQQNNAISCHSETLGLPARPSNTTQGSRGNNPSVSQLCNRVGACEDLASLSEQDWFTDPRLAGLLPYPKSAWSNVLLGNGPSRLRDHEQRMLGHMKKLQQIKGSLQAASKAKVERLTTVVARPDKMNAKIVDARHSTSVMEEIHPHDMVEATGLAVNSPTLTPPRPQTGHVISPSLQLEGSHGASQRTATVLAGDCTLAHGLPSLYQPQPVATKRSALWKPATARVNINAVDESRLDLLQQGDAQIAGMGIDVNIEQNTSTARSLDTWVGLPSNVAGGTLPDVSIDLHMQTVPQPSVALDHHLIRLWRPGLQAVNCKSYSSNRILCNRADPNPYLSKKSSAHDRQAPGMPGGSQSPNRAHNPSPGSTEHGSAVPDLGVQAQQSTGIVHGDKFRSDVEHPASTYDAASGAMVSLVALHHDEHGVPPSAPSFGSDSRKDPHAISGPSTEKGTPKTSLRCDEDKALSSNERTVWGTSTSCDTAATSKQGGSPSHEAQKNSDGKTAQDLYQMISAFCLVASWSVTVATYSRVVLELLERHDGYLCKETDPGKFTVAFRSWKNGLLWAAQMKQTLALQQYPEDIIDLPELAARYDRDGNVLSRGVQPQIGCCHGRLQRKRPTAMGTADYYGVTANTAARIMAKALPGQVLIDGHIPFLSRTREVFDEVHAMGVELRSASCSEKVGAVLLYPRGKHLLKGIRKPVPIFEAKATWFPDTVVRLDDTNTSSDMVESLKDTRCLSSYEGTVSNSRHDGSTSSMNSHVEGNHAKGLPAEGEAEHAQHHI